MTGTDVACIDLVVVEILVAQRTVFVADQAVFLDRFRVEFEWILTSRAMVASVAPSSCVSTLRASSGVSM